MHMRRLDLALFVCVFVVIAFTPAFGDEYTIDPNHSNSIFKVNHLGAGNVFGAMPDISGTLSFDADKPENCAVSIVVGSESLTTFNQRRDVHLKSADFFNTKEFAEITFKSTSCEKVAGQTYELNGDFTLLGVTKSIKVQASFMGRGQDQRGTELAGFESTFTIDRTDFGMKYGVADSGGVGKEVTITVALECQKQ